MANRRLTRPVHLVLDYDGTLTVNDTMSMLGTLPARNPSMSWKSIEEAYSRDYQHYKSELFPWKTYDQFEYGDWLARREWVERRSAERAEHARFFRGITTDDIRTCVLNAFATGSLQLRDGWIDLFALFLSDYDRSTGRTGDSKITILSVNWSGTAIRRTLWEAARASEHPQKDAICQYINDLDIRANEIEGLDSPDGSSGRVCRPGIKSNIRTNKDKTMHLDLIKQDVASSVAAVVARSPPFVVYVGDSPTDFDCLCEADLGIWLYDATEENYEQQFKKTFQPLKIALPRPLREVSELARTPRTPPWFAWDRNFDGLMRLLTAK